MTQREFDIKMAEINILYSERKETLIAQFESELQEIDQFISDEKHKYDINVINLHHKCNDLVEQDCELQRQGLTHYSEERNAVQTKMRGIKLQLQTECANNRALLSELYAKRRATEKELHQKLLNNDLMKQKAKKKLWAKLDR